MKTDLTRRQWLGTAATAGALALKPATVAAAEPLEREPFRYSLNTSTIRGQKIPLADEIDIAAKAGYHAIEPWISELEAHVKGGGSLKDLAKKIRDVGLVCPSSIGFAQWIIDDDDKRKQGLEQAKRDMDLVAQLGGQRIAAPPTGATNQSDLNLMKAAERYRALLEIGDRIGVVPQCEVWGFSKSLSRLGETALVAIESRHPKACVLPDVYHLYKGGSEFQGMPLLSSTAVHMVHVNDYPTDPPREKITDAHRVYPGDGVAPLKEMLRGLRDGGYRGFLSLELFNPDYWKQDAMLVAKTGLAKIKAVVASALA